MQYRIDLILLINPENIIFDLIFILQDMGKQSSINFTGGYSFPVDIY